MPGLLPCEVCYHARSAAVPGLLPCRIASVVA